MEGKGEMFGINHSPDSPVLKGVPPWKETEPNLTDSQRITAELSFSRALLENCMRTALDRLSQLRVDTKGELESDRKPKKSKDKKLVAQKATLLLRTYQVLISGDDEEIDKFRQQSELNSTAEVEVREMLPELEKEKDKIFLSAKDWSTDDEAREIGKTYNYSENLSKELKISLQQSMGINTNALKETLRKWGITIATTFGGARLETILATTSGILLNKYTPLESYDTKYLLGFLVTSYAGWVYGIGKNMKSNYSALKERGESTRLSSKVAYNLANASTKSERMKKIAAATGYILPEFQFEAVSVAALISSKTSTPEAIVFMSGVNTAGAIYEKLVSSFTNKYLNYKRSKLRKKVISQTKSMDSDLKGID